MKKLLAIAAFTLGMTSSALAEELRVASVGDGDTIRVKQGSTLKTIRLSCIDAPETSQSPWGFQSASRLRQFLPKEQVISLREVGKDRYGRTVAEVFVNGKSINLQMVAEGQAVVYSAYLSACPETKQQYLDAQVRAKAEKLGFWNQANPLMPWDYRKTKGGDAADGQPCSPAYPDVCIPASPQKSCKDVGFQRFRVLAPDPQRFDRDGDGIGCEG